MAAEAKTRKRADERRDDILVAARAEFAARGFTGASTDAIARSAGISQPYLFRLYGTKKGLFIAAIDACMNDVLELFRRSAGNLRGEAALEALAAAYMDLIQRDPQRLHAQMQAYAASNDPEIQRATRRGFGALVAFAESLDVPQERVTEFFAIGMLINVLSMLGAPHVTEPWMSRLCGYTFHHAE